MATAGKVRELAEGISGAAIQQDAASTDLSTIAVGRYERRNEDHVSQSLLAVNSSCKIERSYHANYQFTCSFHLDQTFYWAAIREKEEGALAFLLNNQLDLDVSTSTSKSHMIEVPSVKREDICI